VIAPCKDCQERDYPHCHMICERYKTYQEERAKIRQDRWERATTRHYREERFEKINHERLMKKKNQGR